MKESYNMKTLTQTIEGIYEMAIAETQQEARNVLFSARDFLEMYQTESQHTAMTWEDILECKNKKRKKNT